MADAPDRGRQAPELEDRAPGHGDGHFPAIYEEGESDVGSHILTAWHDELDAQILDDIDYQELCTAPPCDAPSQRALVMTMSDEQGDLLVVGMETRCAQHSDELDDFCRLGEDQHGQHVERFSNV